MAKGKFIVIDGTDGSGKGTQTRILIEKLKQE
jgi:thymidylate kinase